MDVPQTGYAKSGEVNIAYQVLGDGPFDVVWVPGAFSHVELNWTVPHRAAFNRRLASFCRLIMSLRMRATPSRCSRSCSRF